VGHDADRPVREEAAKTLKPPSTYAEWGYFLERIPDDSDDEELLATMMKGTLTWQDGVAERFVSRFHAAFEAKLKHSSDLLSRDIQRATSEQHLVVALLGMRRRLSYLHRLSNLPCLPDYIRDNFATSVKRSADMAQKSLEDSARGDRAGLLAAAIRNNPVNSLSNQTPSSSAQEGGDWVLTPKRKILL
jgi:hypothetical protein